MKKFSRSRTDRIIAGVIGGIAEYTGVDSTLLRIITLFIVLTTGIVPGCIAYFLAIVMTPEPRMYDAPPEKPTE